MQAVERTAGKRLSIDSFPFLLIPPPAFLTNTFKIYWQNAFFFFPFPVLKPVGIKTWPFPRAPWFGSVLRDYQLYPDTAFTLAEKSPLPPHFGKVFLSRMRCCYCTGGGWRQPRFGPGISSALVLRDKDTKNPTQPQPSAMAGLTGAIKGSWNCTYFFYCRTK